jgi:hypothetical protein
MKTLFKTGVSIARYATFGILDIIESITYFTGKVRIMESKNIIIKIL